MVDESDIGYIKGVLSGLGPRIEGIEGTQKEILRLQIGQVRDLASVAGDIRAHVASPHPIAHGAAENLENDKEDDAAEDKADARAAARLKRNPIQLGWALIEYVWDNKKAAALALTFLGVGGGGHYAIGGCGKPAASATPTPVSETADARPHHTRGPTYLP